MDESRDGILFYVSQVCLLFPHQTTNKNKYNNPQIGYNKCCMAKMTYYF